jgi:hypothetical protein
LEVAAAGPFTVGVRSGRFGRFRLRLPRFVSDRVNPCAVNNLNNDYREMGPVAGERKRALRRSRDFRLPVRAGKIKLIIRLHPIPGLRSLQGGIQSAVGYALRPPSLDGMRSCGRRPRAKNQPHDRIAGSLAGLDAAACVWLAAVRWRRRLTVLQTGSCRLRKRRIRRGSGRVHSSK